MNRKPTASGKLVALGYAWIVDEKVEAAWSASNFMS